MEPKLPITNDRTSLPLTNKIHSRRLNNHLLNERKECKADNRHHTQKLAISTGAKHRMATPAGGRAPPAAAPSRPLYVPAAGRGGARRCWRLKLALLALAQSVTGVLEWSARVVSGQRESEKISEARAGAVNQSPARPTVGPTPKMQGPLLAAALLLLLIAHLCAPAHAQGMQFDAHHFVFSMLIPIVTWYKSRGLICGKIRRGLRCEK